MEILDILKQEMINTLIEIGYEYNVANLTTVNEVLVAEFDGKKKIIPQYIRRQMIPICSVGDCETVDYIYSKSPEPITTRFLVVPDNPKDYKSSFVEQLTKMDILK